MADIGEEIGENKQEKRSELGLSSVDTEFSLISDLSRLSLQLNEDVLVGLYLSACADLFVADALELKIVPNIDQSPSSTSVQPYSVLEASYSVDGQLTSVVASLYQTYMSVNLMNYHLVLPAVACGPVAKLVNETNSECLFGKFVIRPKVDQIYVSFSIQLHYFQIPDPSAVSSHLQQAYNSSMAYYKQTIDSVFKPFIEGFGMSRNLSAWASEIRQALTQLDLKNFNEKQSETQVEFVFGLSGLLKDRSIPIYIVVSAENLTVSIVHPQNVSRLPPKLKACIRTYFEKINSKMHAKLLMNEKGQIYLEHIVSMSLVTNLKDSIRALVKNNLRCNIEFSRGLNQLQREWNRGVREFDYEELAGFCIGRT